MSVAICWWCQQWTQIKVIYTITIFLSLLPIWTCTWYFNIHGCHSCNGSWRMNGCVCDNWRSWICGLLHMYGWSMYMWMRWMCISGCTSQVLKKLHSLLFKYKFLVHGQSFYYRKQGIKKCHIIICKGLWKLRIKSIKVCSIISSFLFFLRVAADGSSGCGSAISWFWCTFSFSVIVSLSL